MNSDTGKRTLAPSRSRTDHADTSKDKERYDMKTLRAGILVLLLAPLSACADQVVGWPRADQTAPTVTSTTPVDDALDVALNAPISATFSEAMDPETLSEATFSLRQGTTNIAGAVIYSGVTALFAPTMMLDHDTLYTATITTGVTDLAGNEMAAPYEWSFTTGVLVDDIPPRVSATSPVDGATGVALDGTLSATFSEVMDPQTLSEASFTLLAGTTPVSGTVSYSGITATFDPAATLAGETVYTATIHSTATDLAGNRLAADYVWTFTTGTAPDTTRPQVTSTSPANQTADVPLNAHVSATFSEAMDALTISTASFTVLAGSTPISGTVTYSGVTATFAPTDLLAGSTTYTARIRSTASDLSGNGLAEDYVWTFTSGATPDTTPPQVSSTIPALGATEVALNTLISATFTESMAPHTISTATFTVLAGTTPVAGTVTYSGVTATFDPAADLAGDTTYTAMIHRAATDLAGNALAQDYEWSFTTGTAPDTTRPMVSSTTPANGETAVAFNAPISANFSEAMNPLTITTATFTVFHGTTPVAGSVTYVGVTAIFAPDQILAPETLYSATITSAATDLAGNALAADYNWTFTTGVAVDVTPPQVSSTVPANGVTGVALNAPLSATFSEAMNPLTISTATFTLRAGATPVAGVVTYVGVTATFDPSANLAGDTTYTATISHNASDLAGNEMAQDYVWSFTTGTAPDTTRPMVSATTPANGATAVALNAPISATFSEAMNPLTISNATFTLRGASAVSGTVSFAGVTALFAPSVALSPATQYTATISGTVTDLAGNAMATDYVWRFTTGAAVDTTPPLVSSTVPVAGATNVPLNGNITATFSEVMNPLTISTASFSLLAGTTPVAGTVTYVGVTATFDPNAALAGNTTYTARIRNTVKDLAGNNMVQDYVWSFATGTAPDTTRPAVLSTTPAHGESQVALNSSITATFSEAMNPATISTATFTLFNGASPVSGAVSYVGVVATFDPTNDLNGDTTYTATITASAADLAGNTLVTDYIWTFTTGSAPETVPPRVISTDPVDDATGVDVAANISATFSEAMNPHTITAANFTVQQLDTRINGTVTYSGLTATFNPSSDLPANTTFSATITTEAKDLAGNPLVQNYVWNFATSLPIEVSFIEPTANATLVCPSTSISATFIVPLGGIGLDPLSVDALTFVVTGPGPGFAPVTASSIEVDAATGLTATFTPMNDLTAGVTYTATLVGGLDGVADLAGNTMASDYTWSFTAGPEAGNCVQPIDLGAAATFGGFGGSAGMTNQGIYTVIFGDIGTTAVSTSMTGFHDSPTCIYTETPLNFGTVIGKIYTAAPPPTVACPEEGTAVTFAFATAARAAALAAYNELVAKPGGPDPGFGNLANLTLAPGVYTAAAGSFMIQGGDLTLDAQGDANAVWVFQMATTLTVGGPGASAPQSIILTNGAQANNVYWQVGSAATINAAGGGTMVGTIIAQAGAEFSTAGNVTIVTLNGRALSLGASVTLVNTVINVPAP